MLQIGVVLEIQALNQFCDWGMHSTRIDVTGIDREYGAAPISARFLMSPFASDALKAVDTQPTLAISAVEDFLSK